VAGVWDGIRRFVYGPPSESDLGGQIAYEVDRRLGIADYQSIPAVARARELIVSLSSMLEPVAWTNGYPIASRDQPRVLVRPSPEITRGEYLAQLVGSLFDHGNAILWQPMSGRNAAGRAEVSIVLPFDEVSVQWADESRLARKYHWAGRDLIPGRDVLHVAINRPAGELTGRSPLDLIADSLARILAAELYAGSWYEGNAVPSVVLKFDGVLTDTTADEVRAKWIERHRDHSPAVLPKGWDVSQPGANPEQSQLLETRKHGALEVARGLGIFPPELLLAEVGGSSLTYQNIAEALMTFLRVTVQPLYLAPVEEALSDLLPGTQSARFSTAEVERLNTAARWQAYEVGIRAGFVTVEQIDRWEGWRRDVPPDIPAALAATPAAPEVPVA
jgi:HK97 family phage portal protein